MKLRFPSVQGSTQQQVEQLTRYLYSLVQDLNFALEQLEKQQGQQKEDNHGNVPNH
nr:MAG TPA: hypothetical protein [Caudoviricetes sp.]